MSSCSSKSSAMNGIDLNASLGGLATSAAAGPGTSLHSSGQHDVSLAHCCLVCLKGLTNAASLACGHTCCTECLLHYNKTYYSAREDTEAGLEEGEDCPALYCPTCQQEIPASLVTTSIQQEVQNGLDEYGYKFPTGCRGTPLSASIKSSSYSSEPEPQTCDACESQGTHIEAEFYCGKCFLDLCRSCKDIHDQQGIFKTHTTIHYSNKDSINWFCRKPNHRKQACLYFCETCCVPACCVCVLTEHTAHDTNKLKEVLSSRRDRLKMLLDAVGPRIERLSARMRRLVQQNSVRKPRISATSTQSAPPQQNHYQTTPNHHNHRHHISTVSKTTPSSYYNHSPATAASHNLSNRNAPSQNSSTHTGSEGIEMETFSEAEGSSSSSLDSELQLWQAEMLKLHALYDRASRLAESAQSRKLLTLYDDFSKRLTTVDEVELGFINDDMLDRLERDLKTSEGCPSYPVSPGQSTGSLHDRNGSSTLTSYSSTPLHSRATSREDDLLVDPADQFMLLKPKLLWKLEKTRQDVGELWNPSGIAFRPHGGGVVVAEYDIMNEKNNRLRLFDDYGTTQGVLAQGAIKPLGVAVNRDGNIAVTDCNIKRVKIFSQDGIMIQELGKSQFGWPYGIVCNSHGQYIVSDPFHDTIHIFNHDGRKVKAFGSSGTKCSEFKNPFHLTTDSQDNIYISDSGNNCIKVFDPHGNFMFKSSDPVRTGSSSSSRGGDPTPRHHHHQHHHKGGGGSKSGRLKGPRGIALDLKRNLLVADDCGRVCLLEGEGGSYVRTLLSEEDSVKYPEALASHPPRGLLALTEWNPNNMFAVKVFSMYV